MKRIVCVALVLVSVISMPVIGSVYPFPTDPTTGSQMEVFKHGGFEDRDTSGNGLSDYEELFVYGTDPLEYDTLFNGLSDYEEAVTYETDPLKYDTNNNGISDATYVEYNQHPMEQSLLQHNYESFAEHYAVTTDPVFDEFGFRYSTSTGDGFSDEVKKSVEVLQTDMKNVVVHIEYMEDVYVDIEELIAVREQFKEHNISIAYRINPEPVEYRETVTENTYQNHYKPDDTSGKHHVLFADEVRLNGEEVMGFALPETPGAVVGSTDSVYRSGVLMHELGHRLGLFESVFDGVDSHSYSTEEYDSIMNYNGFNNCTVNYERCVRFSDGGEFDDWEYIKENLHSNNPPLR